MKKRTRTKPTQKGKGTTLKEACDFLNHWANDPGPTQEEYEAALKGTGLSRFKLIWRMRNITAYRTGQMGILTIKAKRGEAFKRTDGSFDTSRFPITTKRYLCAHGTQTLLTD